jgi:alpha-tubulin suppressor-like RCC1 family protein
MDTMNRSVPTPVLHDPTFPTTMIEATQISTRWSHTCVIRGADDEVWCWGAGGDGRLGNRETANSSTPVRAGTLTGATAVATGKLHTCAILDDRTTRCWGSGGDGRLGNNDNAGSLDPVEVVDPVAPSDPFLGFVALSLGQDFSCALDSMGGPWCWGKDDGNQLGAGNPGSSEVPLHVLRSMASTDLFTGALGVGAGLNFGVTFTAEPGLYTWGGGGGSTGFPRALVVSSEEVAEILEVGMGHFHGCVRVLPAAGTPAELRCWGRGDEGQLGDGDTVSRASPVSVLREDGARLQGVTHVAAGFRHSCAIVDESEVYCWGSNSFGQLGRSGGGMSTRAIRVDGLPM